LCRRGHEAGPRRWLWDGRRMFEPPHVGSYKYRFWAAKRRPCQE
jgi:hypothetical protein